MLDSQAILMPYIQLRPWNQVASLSTRSGPIYGKMVELLRGKTDAKRNLNWLSGEDPEMGKWLFIWPEQVNRNPLYPCEGRTSQV